MILSPAEREAVLRITGLVVMNAMIFHVVLEQLDERVTPLEKLVADDLPLYLLDDNWQSIIEKINYYPIFHLARQLIGCISNDGGLVRLLRYMAGQAQRIVGMRAALKHDLMGRVYHRLLADAKYLGTYYTGVPAALVLLKLALRPEGAKIDWQDLDQLKQFHVADLACGTGTLLMAAADAITSNYVSRCAGMGQPVDLAALQRVIAEDVLHGYDVLPSALHLTASTLALRAPEVLLGGMSLFSLPLGGEEKRLGSIEFLDSDTVETQGLLFSDPDLARQLSVKGETSVTAAALPELDLCVMNPPFTRSVGGNLLFGSAPDKERAEMQRKLKSMMAKPGVFASITAGLGSVFIAVADRHLKDDGRLALVLPKAVLSGVAWNETRDLLRGRYELEYVVASHDPLRWNFSESTDLSEVLLVAKRRSANGNSENSARVVCVNLWRNPTSAFEALAVARALVDADPPDLVEGQGSANVEIGRERMAEVVSVSWGGLREAYSWLLPCAFAQTELTRFAAKLLAGSVSIPGYRDSTALPLRPLGEMGTLGPDRRDIHDGFDVSDNVTPYAAFWGHDAARMTTLAQEPNSYLSPLPKAKKGRGLRKLEDLWPLASRMLIGERIWLKTQRLLAAYVSRPVLSNVWWPFSLRPGLDRPASSEALTLWLNSTLGLLLMLVYRQETRGAWIDFKKPLLMQMPTLDIIALTDSQFSAITEAYERLAHEPLLPFPEMAHDPVRAEIDNVLSNTLGLPDLSPIREMLAREPIISLQRL